MSLTRLSRNARLHERLKRLSESVGLDCPACLTRVGRVAIRPEVHKAQRKCPHCGKRWSNTVMSMMPGFMENVRGLEVWIPLERVEVRVVGLDTGDVEG